MAKCENCGKEVEDAQLERKVLAPGGETINGVQEAPTIGVCSDCNDKFRAELEKANHKLSEPNGEQN